MTLKTGVYDIASLQAANNVSAVKIGYDNIAEILAADNAAFTAIVDDMLADLVTSSSDRLRLVGSSIGGSAVELDEYGQAPTQRDIPAYFVGFPLKRIGYAIGFTAQWLKNAKGSDVAVRNTAAQGAHMRRIRYEIQKALFTPTNASFTDALVDKATLPVKALINADSTAMQNGPNGEVFDGSSHTHYNASATLTASAVQALVDDVVEHRNGARVAIYINASNAAAFAALTGFYPALVPDISINANANQLVSQRLDVTRPDNRFVGEFSGAKVFTKPWVPANYAIAVDLDAPQKTMVKRAEENDQGMHVAAKIDAYPLFAEDTEWFYGFGVWNRVAAAVLYFASGSYAAPTLSY